MIDKIDFSSKKALLVEDNEMNVMLFSIFLRRLGIQFKVATDGEDALLLIDENHFDIILTDIHLPKLWGDEMTKIIRKLPDTLKANTPIVALTASVDSADTSPYLEAGINEVIQKPFTEKQFVDVLSKFLRVG